MKISVVITTYNGSKYIIQQLESIKCQTQIPDEVLIFDDCSTDNTAEVIRDFIKNNKLKNWKIEKNSEKKGWKLNFIDGFKKASGDIIFPCDQDDIWHVNKIKEMSEILKEREYINVLVANYTKFFDGINGRNNKIYINDNLISKIEVNNYSIYNSRPGCVYAFKKDFFMKYKELWNGLMPHDDFLWKTAVLTNSLYLFNQSVIEYRRHGATTTKNRTSLKEKRESAKAEYLYFSECANNKDIKAYLEFVKEHIEFSKFRINALNKRNLKNLFKIFKYRKYYKTKKSFLGELLYILNIRGVTND